MNLKEVEKLIQIILDTDIEEIEFSRNGDSLRIKRTPASLETVQKVSVAESKRESIEIEEKKKTEEVKPEKKDLFIVKAPLVGTFYRAPSPDAKPFVDVGETVAKGEVLCIVEAMKLMNEIESEIDGKICSILIENGRPVEYGEPLFEIEPLK